MSDGARETGDRARFLGRLAARRGAAIAVGPHPPPAAPGTIPEVRFRSLDGVGDDDGDALLAIFVAAAERAEARVHLVGVGEADRARDRVIGAIVEQHSVERAVVSAEPEAQAVRAALRACDIAVSDHDPAVAAEADLGVTGAVAAVAATGSVVVDADLAGGRAPSLLPTVHLCLVPRDRIVATTAEVLRRPSRPLPAHRLLITGPSRTGDIEQILTTGAHGPAAVHIVVT